MRVSIIGAGPAGLVCADKLTQTGAAVSLHEASADVGGMSRSFKLWGQTVDVGPHRFFSSDPRVNKVWLEHVGSDYVMVKRLTRIFYRGRFFQYPLQPMNALRNLGPLEALRCLLNYAAEQISPTKLDGSFETWVCSRFGRRLFEVFFKTYSEKLWGIPCTELDADFAAQRIRKFSLGAAIKSAFLPQSGGHRTLVDEFAYPTGGAGMVYKRMADAVKNRGGRIHLQSPVRRVLVSEGKVTGIELLDGSVEFADQVVSTMPLTKLIETLPDVPSEVREAAKKLTFRNTIIIYLEIAGKNLFPDNWIYVHSTNLGTGRITNFRNWAPQICADSPNTIIALEYWSNDDDAIWQQSDSLLVSSAAEELLSTKLVENKASILNGKALRVARSYPVYRRGYGNLLTPIQKFLDGVRGLHVIGRYGSFKYNNQDHSILMGILAAENIAVGRRHDLWDVNSDYETYQEQSQITASGLAVGK